ncbi:MAG: LLM class F420-dependent oxidoreductase [Acidimicrobiia bacterium]
MELALSPSSPGLTATELVELCVEAERHGYEAAWLAEVSGPESFALAGAVAARTEAMRLGVAVVPAGSRTATLLAMGAATVSQIARGRPFCLGIGSSSRVIVERWHGGTFRRPLLRVREAVEATRALLAGERGYQGETVRTSGFRLTSPPAGPVPIYVGALGPGMLQVAGAVGDGVCLNLMPPSMVPAQLAEVQRGAQSVGRALPEDFEVMARFHVMVTDDVDEARRAFRAGFGPYFAQPVYNRFLAWCGYPEEAGAIVSAWERRDCEGLARALHDQIIDDIGVIGPAGRVRARLDEFAAAGVTVGALNFLGPDRTAIGSAIADLAPG